MIRRIRERRRSGQGESGNAIVEFIFVGIVIMVPLVYLLLAVFDLQRNVFAVTEAAREAGRALATADTVSTGVARAEYAAGLSLGDQGLSSEGATVSYAPAGASCDAAGSAATLTPGQDFAVCVSRTFTPPGIPGYVVGDNNTVTGRFVVHIDRYRSAS